MGIGIGIFLGLALLGAIYLYTQTKDRWNWTLIVKRALIGLGVIILLPIILTLGALGYESITSYFDSRPKIVRALADVNIGDALSDIRFKHDAIADKNDSNINRYLLKDIDIAIEINQETKKVDFILAICGQKHGVTTLNGISCDSKSEALLEHFGKSNVRIMCEVGEPKKEGKPEHRLYDVPKYGIRYGLVRDSVQAFIVSTPKYLENPSTKNWIECNKITNQ